MSATDPLDRVLAECPPPFALLHRPEATGGDVIEVLLGTLSTADELAGVPLSAEPNGQRHETLVLAPYRQVIERGFAAPDDGAPLVALTVDESVDVALDVALARLPDVPIDLAPGGFDVSDDEYAATVRDIVTREIGCGEGANFVLKRSFVAGIEDYSIAAAFTFFRRLLRQERGAYWTFMVHTGDRVLVGATPERHVSLREGTVVMNPISGTYRYPPGGPELPELMRFLAERKEIDELYMVLDEELKMMARVCPNGGRVVGPYLREMARLAHTEYFIEGRSAADPRDILRETMYAPTVTGSPLENACRIIQRYEPAGRGYYSGVAALIGRDEDGGRTLDSAILIRTADIDSGGRLRIGVGATLVRHSDPLGEVAETHAKAAGLLAALGADRADRFATHPDVVAALADRNETISKFWRISERDQPDPELTGRQVLVVDAEDTFTSMLAQVLRSIGLSVSVRRFDERYELDGHDLVVLGPGPGDPSDDADPKIRHLAAAVDELLSTGRPFLAVCLSHQVLSRRLGLPVVRRTVPNQGVQRTIDLFGNPVQVGFYNTFAAHADVNQMDCGGAGVVQIARDETSGEVHALRGPGFSAMQFHPESVLTQEGVGILGTAICSCLHTTNAFIGQGG